MSLVPFQPCAQPLWCPRRSWGPGGQPVHVLRRCQEGAPDGGRVGGAPGGAQDALGLLHLAKEDARLRRGATKCKHLKDGPSGLGQYFFDTKIRANKR